jgi:hypothetical protein
MLAYVDLVTALAGEQTALFLHAAVVGFELALAVAEVGTPTASANNDGTRTSRDVLLLGVVLVAVLQAAQFQITPHLGGDAFTTDLAAHETGVTPTVQADLPAGIDRGFTPGRAVAETKQAVHVVGADELLEVGERQVDLCS